MDWIQRKQKYFNYSTFEKNCVFLELFQTVFLNKKHGLCESLHVKHSFTVFGSMQHFNASENITILNIFCLLFELCKQKEDTISLA